MTDFQEVYDAFFIKTEKDFLYEQDQVYQFLKSAISRSYKTTTHKLDNVLKLDNVVLTIYNMVENDGQITLNINTNTYQINLVNTDTNKDVANKIKTAINNEWDVVIDYSNNFPIITITKNGIDKIDCSFIDTDETGIYLSIKRTYDGYFTNTLDQDEIELISLYMKKEYLRKKLSHYEELKSYIGTKDFNKLPDKMNEYKKIKSSMDDLDIEITSLRNEFNTYKY